MFLPFGRNNVISTYEMLPQCVERISKMNGVSKTYLTVIVLILTVTPSNTTKNNKWRYSKDGCRTYLKEQLSPQMIKRSPTTVVHKDPQSYQLGKTDHVENGQEGLNEPIATKVCTLFQSLCIRTNFWNMETTSKLWDLNFEVESLEKANFLYYPGAPNYCWRGKGRRRCRGKNLPNLT